MVDTTIERQLFSRRVIDNRKVSMTDALKYLLTQPEYRELDVAVGYFYISGLLLLKDEFLDFMDNRNGHFRILMGNETNGETVNVLDKSNYQSYDQFIYDKANTDAKGISDKEFLGKIARWIEEGRIEAKVYTGDANYFHAKSYLFAASLNSARGTAIVGSSNLSRAGLQGNTELNVLTQDGFYALHNWYNTLWLSDDEVSDFSPDLIKVVQANGARKITQEYKPVEETYYDFANMYGKPYAELDDSKKWVKNLFEHQRSGIVSVKEKLDSLDTAVLSDGVGLGKTRTAAGVIRLYLESQAINNILVVADTKLKDQWHDELAAVGVMPNNYSFISRQKLVGIPNSQLTNSKFTLLVIDEAHLGFKNNNTEAYRKVSYMKKVNPRLKGLMLTATPWNNQREDVINIGSLFLNVDAIANDRKYKQYFLLSPNSVTNKVVKRLAVDDQAFKEFWDDIYLQRTRKTYGGQGAKFPHRNFPSVDIPYEPRKNEIFSNNFDTIADLKFPYQDPIKYVDDSKEELGSKQLKMMLLKRADSSWKAFADSLQHIVDKLEKLKNVYLDPMSYLKGKELLNRYKEFLRLAYHTTEYESRNDLGLFKDFYQDEVNTDNNESDQSVKSLIRKKRYLQKLEAQISSVTNRKAQNAVNKMITDCNKDLVTLKQLISNLKESYSNIDEKVDKIIECIDKERSLSHKIILVSQFADTVEYYYDKIYSHYNSSKITLPMGMITGAANTSDGKAAAMLNKNSSTKKDVLEHFSPISKKRPELIKDNTVIDLVIGTDTISTGQNLQDAVTLMNIDLPYNPMTLEQRIGRIDRPLPEGSKKDQIYIYTFPIYQSINSQLKMMKRLGNKMEGILNDTEFDNVVLPQYEDYLKDITAKKKNAVKTMLDKTDDQLLNHTDFSSEKHSQAYQIANKRMYNYKINQLKPFPNPLIPNYSFSTEDNEPSVLVVEVEFHDVNDAYLGKERILIDPNAEKKIGVVEAERAVNNEIAHDLCNSSRLSKDKALLAVHAAEQGAKKVVAQRVQLYNKQHKFFAKNAGALINSTSKIAAQRLLESANRNQTVAIQKLQEQGIDPKKLTDIAKYIQTIDKDNDLFPIVKEIANNPDVFWLNIKDYAEFFNPDIINEVESVGKNIKKSDTRQADLGKTQYKVIVGNLVIK